MTSKYQSLGGKMTEHSVQEHGWGVHALLMGFGTIAAELFLVVTLYEQASSKLPWNLHRVSTLIGLLAAILWGAIPWLVVRKEFKKLTKILFNRGYVASTDVELIALRKSEINMLWISTFPFFTAVMVLQSLVDR
jgi:hypothetical protein